MQNTIVNIKVNFLNDKKNIILISPISGIFDSLYKAIPLALLAISRKIDRNKYNIIIIDQKMPGWKGKLKRVLLKDIFLVGITALTGHQLHYGSLIAQYIKKHKKNVSIVWGGVHPSASPISMLKKSFVDYVIIGEGENIFSKLIKVLDEGKNFKKIEGLGYKTNDNKIIINSSPDFIDVDRLEDISYDLIDVKSYMEKIDNHEFYVEGARGCPYSCTFCYNSILNKSRWRPRSAKRIVGNIKYLYNKYGIYNFFIIDDSFFISKKRLWDFVFFIKKNSLDIKWSCEANISSLNELDESLLEALISHGMSWISIGVESGSKKVRNFVLDKTVDIKKLIKFNRRISNYNVNIRYNFITGTPIETKKDLKMTIRLIDKLLRENSNAMVQPIFITVPYPGTQYLKQCIIYGFKPPTSLDAWGDFDPFTISKYLPWFKGNKKRMFEFLMYCSYFIDKKFDYHLTNSPMSRILKMLSRVYYPIARFRFSNFFYYFFFEIYIFKLIIFVQMKIVENKLKL